MRLFFDWKIEETRYCDNKFSFFIYIYHSYLKNYLIEENKNQ
jgi:hypothetical protein